MHSDFPAAVPEIPVSDINKAAEYYVKNLGFKIDWGARMAGLRASRKGFAECF